MVDDDASTERLAVAPGPASNRKEIAFGSEAPTVRLAAGGNLRGSQREEAFAPTVRLACADGQGERGTVLDEPFSDLGNARPALLVSFFYLTKFLEKRGRWAIRDWVLDSGAFSAWASGATIDLQAFIETAKRLLVEDPQLSEVFSLDVIGDWRASEKNTETMWKAGVPAIPAWHKGEPWDVLVGLARAYPKIALGGLVGMRDQAKRELIKECFRRVWAAVGPKRMHGFGVISEKTLMAVPFHSVDATNWEIAPCRFGTWKSAGGAQLRIRGSAQPLRAEVEWYLALERRLRERWRKEMAKWPPMEPLRAVDQPTVRLAVDAGSASGQRADAAFSGKKPEGGTP